MMRRSRVLLSGATILVLVGVGAVFAAPLFLPEKAQRLDEAMPAHAHETAVSQGTFSGKAGHHVSGTVRVVEAQGVYFLRFEDYEQTQGPDVFVYLTPDPDPDSRSEVKAGLKVLIDGGADGGESTKVGTFNQRLPDGVDPRMYRGVGIWCDRFSVTFGAASLTAA